MILNIFYRGFLKSPRPCRAVIARARRCHVERAESRRLISGEALAHSMLKDKQHDHFHRPAIYLLGGCAAAWDRHRNFARSSCCWRERKQFFRRFSSSGSRLFKSSQHRGATARSTAVVSINGGVLKREPARRGRRIFLGAA